METILTALFIFIVWVVSQWKIILLVVFGIYVLKTIESKILLYEEKLFDIDDNVKQIVERLGINEDISYETPTEKFIRERKERIEKTKNN
jgi:hypothetical protein